VKESSRLSDSFTVTPHILGYRYALLTDMHSFTDAFCARSSAKHQAQLRTIPRGQSHYTRLGVGKWSLRPCIRT
jgi:hypothetical protein